MWLGGSWWLEREGYTWLSSQVCEAAQVLHNAIIKPRNCFFTRKTLMSEFISTLAHTYNNSKRGRLALLLYSLRTQEFLIKLLRLDAVKEAGGLSSASMYKAIAAGQFPRSAAISTRARGWLDSDIDECITARVSESRLSTTMKAGHE